MAQPAPFNTMILNFVAKLKNIGAQLIRKSTRSPNLSFSFASLDPLGSFTSLRTSTKSDQAGLNQFLQDSSTSGPSSSVSEQVKANPGAPSSSQAETGKKAPEQAGTLPIGSLDSVVSAASLVEHDEDEPAVDADRYVGGEEVSLATEENGEDGEEEDSESEEFPDCGSADCSDLFPGENNNSNNNNNINLPNNVLITAQDQSNTVVVVPQHHSERAPQQPDTVEQIETPSVNLRPNGGHHTHKDPNQPNPLEPYGSNELSPYINGIPGEYVERQVSSSASVLGNLNLIRVNMFGLNFLLMLATIFFTHLSKSLFVKWK